MVYRSGLPIRRLGRCSPIHRGRQTPSTPPCETHHTTPGDVATTDKHIVKMWSHSILYTCTFVRYLSNNTTEQPDILHIDTTIWTTKLVTSHDYTMRCLIGYHHRLPLKTTKNKQMMMVNGGIKVTWKTIFLEIKCIWRHGLSMRIISNLRDIKCSVRVLIYNLSCVSNRYYHQSSECLFRQYHKVSELLSYRSMDGSM